MIDHPMITMTPHAKVSCYAIDSIIDYIRLERQTTIDADMAYRLGMAHLAHGQQRQALYYFYSCYKVSGKWEVKDLIKDYLQYQQAKG